MVGGHGIAQKSKKTGIFNIPHTAHFFRHSKEIGRFFHIGTGVVPGKGLARSRFYRPPFGRALEHVVIAPAKHIRRKRRFQSRADLCIAGPDILEENRLPVLALAQRLARKIAGQGASQSIGHHQGRRGQVIGLHMGRDAAFKITVPRQHRTDSQIALANGLGDGFGQRTGIADTGGAADAHHIKS